MAQPANSYVLKPGPPGALGKPSLTWNSAENGVPVTYTGEPSVNPWTSLRVEMLSRWPIDSPL